MTEQLSSAEYARLPSVFLTPQSVESLGPVMRQQAGTTPASAVYPALNLIMYFPFSLPSRALVNRFFWCNGTTASTDNIQVGVYDGVGNAIVRGTSTLAAGASAPQFDNVADFWLRAGTLYYLAIWCGGTTTHIVRSTLTSSRFSRGLGILQESNAGGLQTTATFAQSAQFWIGLFGIAFRSTP